MKLGKYKELFKNFENKIKHLNLTKLEFTKKRSRFIPSKCGDGFFIEERVSKPVLSDFIRLYKTADDLNSIGFAFNNDRDHTISIYVGDHKYYKNLSDICDISRILKIVYRQISDQTSFDDLVSLIKNEFSFEDSPVMVKEYVPSILMPIIIDDLAAEIDAYDASFMQYKMAYEFDKTIDKKIEDELKEFKAALRVKYDKDYHEARVQSCLREIDDDKITILEKASKHYEKGFKVSLDKMILDLAIMFRKEKRQDIHNFMTKYIKESK
jgi:hypothetical protein